MGGLFAGNASVHKPINASAPYYFPLIHHAPIHTNEAVVMYDLNSEPVRRRTITQVLATQAAATTDWLRLVQDTNANLVRRLCAALHAIYLVPLRQHVLGDVATLTTHTRTYGLPRRHLATHPTSQNRIASLALTPVIVDGVVVGISNTVFNWDSVLLQALPSFISGIDAVLSSDLSNRTFTMRIRGGAVEGIGEGDLHQTDANLAEYTRIATAKLGATWTVTLHPTRELLATYRTTGPRDRCIAVLVVIIVCICLFWVHDWLARSRSVMLVRLVQATSRIVEDVFPKNVRSRMVKQALAETAPMPHEEAPLSQGAAKALNLIQKFVGIEAAQVRAVSRRSSALVDFGTGAIADTFPSVTVLFSDIVGFTSWSSTVPPEVVFRMLGGMFAAFDALAHQLGIFKIETIGAAGLHCMHACACASSFSELCVFYMCAGDSYMCVCGLPEQTHAHAERMADFALGMFAAVERACELTGANLQIRVGMHSGTVTAGVLMGERSRFQLFGDTVRAAMRVRTALRCAALRADCPAPPRVLQVNTASRMESTGSPGRVQVSATTASLLRAAGCHALEYRGKVAAKGKGDMDTYWLLARSTGTPWHAPSEKRGSMMSMGTSRSPFFGGSLLGLGRRDSTRSGRSSTRSSVDSMAGIETLQEVVVGAEESQSRRGAGGSRDGSSGSGTLLPPPPLRRAQTSPAPATAAMLVDAAPKGGEVDKADD
jgi:class 3 adenylate cyclase/type IV secretory pathway VirB2 component (pilin)